MNKEEIKNESRPFVEQQRVIDNQKLKRIAKSILILENDNVNTRELNDEEVKKKIQKIIEEEIKCC